MHDTKLEGIQNIFRFHTFFYTIRKLYLPIVALIYIVKKGRW